MRILRSIELWWHGVYHAVVNPQRVAVLRIEYGLSNGEVHVAAGRDAIEILTEKLDNMEHALLEVPDMIHAAYTEGYKTGIHDWAEGHASPSGRADAYMERNWSYVGRRLEDVANGEA